MTRQRQQFDKVAQGWLRWWPTWEESAQILSDRLIALARVECGQGVLDVGTGLGEPAISAARRVGATGRVVAIDCSASLLDLALERAASLNLHNLTFYELNADHLEELDEPFHAVLCRSGLMFLPRLVPSLRMMRQLLLPGGYFAASIWCAAERIPLMTFPQTIIRQHVRGPAHVPDAIAAPRLDNAPALEHALIEAGFRSVHSEALALTFEFATALDYVQYTRDVAPHIVTMLADVPDEQQELIWCAVEGAVQEQYGNSDGRIRLPAEAICVVGVK
jgi:ubiquinone/menaquinone biosynthesis C-methylase UbiE